MTTNADDYVMNMAPKYAALEVIDIGEEAGRNTERWVNQTLCQVNDSLVRLGVVEGEFHWHAHDGEDEFFYVVDGRLLIDLDERTVELAANQGFTVPAGVTHRTRAPVRTVVLMVEPKTVDPRGTSQ